MENLAAYRKSTEALLCVYARRSSTRLNVTSRLEDATAFVVDVERCLRDLKCGERFLIQRIAIEGYTHGETAAMQGMTLRNVIWRYAAALNSLTRLLLSRKLLQP